MPRVVFLTAFNEYALQAFDQNAFDYLLKPIDPARLDITQSACDATAPHAALFDAAAPLKQVPCPGHQRVLLIKVEDIEYATSKNRWGLCHSQQRQRAFHRADAAHAGRKDPFLRCHRQYLVNPDQIKELSFLEAGTVEIVTRNNHHVPVSRRLRLAS